MKRITVGMLAALFGFIVSFSTIGAGELAREGSGKYRSGRTAKLNVLKMGTERMQINFDEVGIVVEAPADSPFCNASFNTMGPIHAVNGVFMDPSQRRTDLRNF